MIPDIGNFDSWDSNPPAARSGAGIQAPTPVSPTFSSHDATIAAVPRLSRGASQLGQNASPKWARISATMA